MNHHKIGFWLIYDNPWLCGRVVASSLHYVKPRQTANEAEGALPWPIKK